MSGDMLRAVSGHYRDVEEVGHRDERLRYRTLCDDPTFLRRKQREVRLKR